MIIPVDMVIVNCLVKLNFYNMHYVVLFHNNLDMPEILRGRIGY